MVASGRFCSESERRPPNSPLILAESLACRYGTIVKMAAKKRADEMRAELRAGINVMKPHSDGNDSILLFAKIVIPARREGKSGFLSDGENALGNRLDDLLMHLVNGEVAFNQDDTIGLANRDLAVLLPDPAIESILFGFKPVFIAAGLRFHAGVAAA